MRLFKQFKRSGWSALKTNLGYIGYVHVERRTNHKPQVSAFVHQSLDCENPYALKSWAQTYGMQQRHCAIVLNRGEYRLIQTEAVDVPRDELKQAIRWKIKEMLDYPASQASLDVLNIPQDQNNPSRQRYMLAIAARNEIIKSRVKRFINDANIGLEVIDIAETAQRNIAALLEQPERGLALLSFSEDGGLLTLTAGTELFHAQQLNVTAEQLLVDDDDKRYVLFERIALDLQRTLDNFERQFSYITINRLVLAPFVRRDQLQKYLSSYLYLPTECLDLKEFFDLSAVPELNDEINQSKAFYLLGCALRERA